MTWVLVAADGPPGDWSAENERTAAHAANTIAYGIIFMVVVGGNDSRSRHRRQGKGSDASQQVLHGVGFLNG